MHSSAILKEQIIQEYISKVKFKSFSIKVIKEDLKRLIKETPAINVEWKKEAIVNEIKGETVMQDEVKSISIAFSDGENPDGTPKVHKVTYFI